MSIYGTECTFWVEDACGRPLEVDCQVVPAWIDYTGPAWEWLPPNRDAPPEWGDREVQGYEHPRAAFFCGPETTKGTERCGQEYVNPLLVLTGEEFERVSFRDLMQRLAERVGSR